MVNIILGGNIKKYRNAKKLTLAVMAERIGVTLSTVAAYEAGTRMPSYEVLLKISNLFNVSTDVLLGNAGKDLIDVSELTAEQRHSIETMVSMHKEGNRMFFDKFPNLTNEDRELYMNSSFEDFLGMMKDKI